MLVSAGVFLAIGFWLAPKKNIVVAMVLILVAYLVRDGTHQLFVLSLGALALALYTEFAAQYIAALLIVGIVSMMPICDGFIAASAAPSSVGYVPVINSTYWN